MSENLLIICMTGYIDYYMQTLKTLKTFFHWLFFRLSAVEQILTRRTKPETTKKA